MKPAKRRLRFTKICAKGNSGNNDSALWGVRVVIGSWKDTEFAFIEKFGTMWHVRSVSEGWTHSVMVSVGLNWTYFPTRGEAMKHLRLAFGQWLDE